MVGVGVNIKTLGLYQRHFGMIARSSEIYQYAYNSSNLTKLAEKQILLANKFAIFYFFSQLRRP